MGNVNLNKMSDNNLQINEVKKEVLLKKYEFYTQEARHQRMMMWETAKWFAAIVVGLTAFSGQFLIRFYNISSPTVDDAIIPIILFGPISLISITCIFLIISFYRTNLIYISMIAKVEEELGFDGRNIKKLRKTFRLDDNITWNKYKEDREKEYEKSEKFVEEKSTIWGAGINSKLSFIFIIFVILSLFMIHRILMQIY